MRVVQVSPFSVIQRSPPVSLPSPEILSDCFLFCRRARKAAPILHFTGAEAAAYHGAPCAVPFPERSAPPRCSFSCISTAMCRLCFPAPNAKTAAEAAAEKGHPVFPSFAVGRLQIENRRAPSGHPSGTMSLCDDFLCKIAYFHEWAACM